MRELLTVEEVPSITVSYQVPAEKGQPGSWVVDQRLDGTNRVLTSFPAELEDEAKAYAGDFADRAHLEVAVFDREGRKSVMER